MSSNMYIRIFYSEKCQDCMNLLNVIFNERIQRMFFYVCLDNMTTEQLMQISFKVVPAISISSQNHNTVVYEGPIECSKWLNSFIYNRRMNIKQQIDQQRRLLQKERVAARKEDGGVIEYNEDEMDGISDGYAYKDTDLYQAKSFVPVGQEGFFNITTLQANESSMSKEDMMAQLSEINKQRSNTDNELKNIMERKQIEAVFNNNNN